MCRSVRGCRCRTSASRSYTRLAIFGNTISDQHEDDDDGGDEDDKDENDVDDVVLLYISLLFQ